MSASNEWWEYHLIPKGWVIGSASLDLGIQEKKPVPEDRVLTLRFHEYMGSSFSSVEKWVKKEWEHNDKNMIEELMKEHGNRPQGKDNKNYPE